VRGTVKFSVWGGAVQCVGQWSAARGAVKCSAWGGGGPSVRSVQSLQRPGPAGEGAPPSPDS
jgi:hypothetical protein